MIGGALGGLAAVLLVYILGWNLPRWTAAGRAAQEKPLAATVAISIGYFAIAVGIAAMLLVPTAKPIFSTAFVALLLLVPISTWVGWRRVRPATSSFSQRLERVPVRPLVAAFLIWTVLMLTYEAFNDPFWSIQSTYGAYERELANFLRAWLLPPAALAICFAIWVWGTTKRAQS